MKGSHRLAIACALSSAFGFAFAAVSTSDFVAHLDRQVHGIHCSFLPGLTAADHTGSSGCHATLMSPYSSVFRDALWGGIPIALPAMAVFAFLCAWAIWLVLQDRSSQPRASGFLLLGSLVPLLASLIMGYLSLVELDAACKSCIGIYISSACTSAFSLALWLRARSRASRPDVRDAPRAPLSWPALALAFGVGVCSVGVSVGAYAASAPDFSGYVGACGSLPEAVADSSVSVAYGPQRGLPRMLEVMDPLCPSCRSFEERFASMQASAAVDRQLLLFPLDQECNWMIDHSIHPGACSISEAVLCATDPEPVVAWAFDQQREIMAAAERDPGAAAAMAKARFPALAACIGSAKAEARVNQSLRFAVKNRLQVLTPQVFVEGVRLCGEDTDLGLSFALSRLIERVQAQPGIRDELLPGPRGTGYAARGLASNAAAAAPTRPETAVSPSSARGRAKRSEALAAEIRQDAEEAEAKDEATRDSTAGSAATENAAAAAGKPPRPAVAQSPGGSGDPKPAAEQPTAEQPTAEQPTAEQPTAEQSSPEAPAGAPAPVPPDTATHRSAPEGADPEPPTSESPEKPSAPPAGAADEQETAR